MKKLLFLILALVSQTAFAASGIQWNWISGTNSAKYNVYQLNAACPTTITLSNFTLMATVSTPTWTQTPFPNAGAKCTVVTGLSSLGVEGAPSPSFQFDTTVPGIPGQPMPTLVP
jgi:hypothetical protein